MLEPVGPKELQGPETYQDLQQRAVTSRVDLKIQYKLVLNATAGSDRGQHSAESPDGIWYKPVINDQ